MRTRGRERVEHRSGGMSGSFKGGIGESATNVKKSEKKMSCFHTHTHTLVQQRSPSHVHSQPSYCATSTFILYGPAEMSITSHPVRCK